MWGHDILSSCLALRRDPEAAVVPQVNQVRAELAKLLAER
jgi:hypothetical protein